MNRLSKPNVAIALLAAVLALLPTIAAQAQNETNNWIFGNKAGITFPGGGSPVPFSGTPNMSTQEGSSSISDQLGNLLFYTDGSSVWDKTHSYMPYGTATLHGGSSSTQSALIVPLPGSDCKKYVVFSAEEVSSAQTSRWSYSIVDMTIPPNGGVVSTQMNILLEPAVAEKQAAIKDGTGGFWVVAHGSGKPLGNPINSMFYVVHVTTGGVSAPVPYTAGSAHEVTAGRRPGAYQVGSGQMKISPDGKLIGCAVGGAFVEVVDFNSATGAVTGPGRKFDISNYPPFQDTKYPSDPAYQYVTTPYGLEFSPKSQVLYVTTFAIPSRLFQIDLQLPYSLSRWTLLWTGSISAYDFGQLQLGPDKKVYAARNNSTNSKISVINNPDTIGAGCNFDNPPGPVVSAGAGPTVSAGGVCQLGLPTMIGGTFSCSPTPSPTGTIKGRKFDDANCNGKDDGEPPLSGWIITLTNTTTHVTVTATTDASGFYYFNNLPAGTYTISETPQSGWTQTMPGGAGTYTVTLGANQVIQEDFGNGHCNISPTPTPCGQVTGEARCLPNGGYSYTFTITNNSGNPASQILLTPAQGSTFTLTPQLTNLGSPLPNGQSTTVTTTISGTKPGDKVCFFVSLMSDKATCCIVQVCVTMPDCGSTSPPPPPPPQPSQLPRGKRRP